MDELDMAILREMARDKVLVWGGLDPRLSAGEIARRLGGDPSTVRARVRAWEEAGFLAGHAIWPNPALFGAHLASGGLRVDDPRQKQAVLDALRDVEGIVGVQEYVGPWAGLGRVVENPEALERQLRLLARLPGVTEVTRPFAPRQPQPTIEPSPLDWRMLDALRRSPEATLQQLAGEVGISSKTFARRYDALVAGRAVWHVPSLDFTRYGGATVAKFIVLLAPGIDPVAAAASFQERFPLMDHHAGHVHAGGANDARGLVELYLHLPSAAAAEEAQRALLGYPGVTEVELLFPKRFWTNGAWFAERLAARLKA
ncbi:MAG TPA: AsnC family transcriptional regulator [Candidatus Thermoplasmatota archaeon]|nr:AsnC family transcriptional regulator [Candidatus Thermoplasmatota archaeon]